MCSTLKNQVYGELLAFFKGKETGAAACQATSPHSCNPAGDGSQHRWVLGDLGLWSLGCDCFAF
jgi:hypothetical protein